MINSFLNFYTLEMIYKCCFIDVNYYNNKNYNEHLKEMFQISNDILSYIVKLENEKSILKFCWDFLISAIDIFDSIYSFSNTELLLECQSVIESIGNYLETIINTSIKAISNQSLNQYYEEDALPNLMIQYKINDSEFKILNDDFANDIQNWNKATKNHVSAYLTIKSIFYLVR